ncbi:uncharacterized protein EAE98_002201 [Botrytis deweyae]|uniref:FAS1 domain-containing protein n=1 Tax=Botrytis deweyae TaxID=2478750 RepID=A0ABQ7IWM6_9HELO|nr:uncharacterized protein EAE98_002201 [Botrytis deweyae]KAF7935981.1 hypothetical protein EAE98_002201 [Botrytis deweyae]
MYINLLTTASLCAVVLGSPQLDRRQDVDASAIASSISSLSSALIPDPSLAAQLTSIPTSVLALQSSPSGFAQLEQEFLSSLPAWYTSLSPAAQTYIINAGPAKASIYSLEALLSSASASATTSAPAAPSITGFLTGIINGTTATLVPITGSGGLTIASGNSTVTTKKLSASATTETETEAKTTETSAKTTETGKNGGGTPSPIESSSKAGAAQVTGLLGGMVMGAVGLVWVL